MSNKIKHPATYSKVILPELARFLVGIHEVLDPFAGTGKLALIKEHGYRGRIVCNGIEPLWAGMNEYDVDEWHVGDAENMSWCPDARFDGICTSPTYGNRMADNYSAGDQSHRITYRHYLGEPLKDGNTGSMQWGDAYREKHVAVYQECMRVSKRGALIIINVSDHIRKWEIMHVVDWHQRELELLGAEFLTNIEIETPRMRFGRNSELRVGHENILLFVVGGA